MFYFLSQFVVYLALALALGVVVGWLIWGGAVEPASDSEDGATAFRERMLGGGEHTEDSALRSQIDELAAQLEAREADVSRLRKRLRRVTTEHSAALAAVAQTGEGAMVDAQGVVVDRGAMEAELAGVIEARLRSELANSGVGSVDPSLQARVEDLAAQHGQAVRERDDALVMMREFDELRGSLDNAVKSTQADLLEERKRVAQLEQQLSNASSRNPGEAEAIRSLQDQLARALETNAALETTMGELEQRMAANSQRSAAVPTSFAAVGSSEADPEVERLRDEIEMLQPRAEQAARFAVEAERARAELNIAKAQSEHAEARIDEALSRADAAHEAAREAQRRADAAHVRSVELEKASAIEVEQVSAPLRNRIDQLEARSAELAHAAEAAERRLAEATAQAQSAQEQVTATAAQVVQSQRQAAEARQQVEASQRAIVESEQRLQDLEARLVATSSQAEEHRKAALSTQEQLAMVSNRSDRMLAEIEQQRVETSQQSEALAAQLAALRSEHAATSSQAEEQRRQLVSIGEAHAAATAETEKLQQQLARMQQEHGTKTKALHSDLSDAKLRADAAQGVMKDLVGELQELRTLAARSRTAQGQEPRGATMPGSPSANASSSSRRMQAGDDLTQLAGVDDQIESNLHELGVRSFLQIGEWNDDDVARMEEMFSDRRGLIRSNDWVLAARRLWAEKHGHPWRDRDHVTGGRGGDL